MRKILALILLLVFCAAGSPHAAHADDAGPVTATPAPAKADDAKPAESKEGEGAPAKKGPTDVSGGRFTGDPIYIHLDPIILPVINENGAEQIITLQIAIEIKDFNAADIMHNNMPRVNDALMRALYGGLGNGSLRNGQLVDVAKIKAKALQAVSGIVGADNVRDVLIEAIAQRRL